MTLASAIACHQFWSKPQLQQKEVAITVLVLGTVHPVECFVQDLQLMSRISATKALTVPISTNPNICIAALRMDARMLGQAGASSRPSLPRTRLLSLKDLL